MTAEFPYKRLPGRLRGWVRKASLWEGPDHLLLLRGTRFQEEYRRFAYGDIESLQMVKRFQSGSFGWLVFNALVCLLLLPSTLRQDGWGRWAMFGAVLGLLLGQLGRSFFFGCRCYVQTAVSREELPSLIRRRAAQKTFARLRVRIAEAQGLLAEDLSALVDASAAAVSQWAPTAVDNAKAARRSVSLALIAFSLFLVDAVQTYPALAGPSVGRHWYNTRYITAVLALSMVGTVAGSLLAGSGVRRLKGLRAWILAALGIEVFDLYVSLFLPSLYSVQGGMTSMSLTQLRIWQTTTYADEILLLVIGIGGMLFVLVNWVRLRRGDL